MITLKHWAETASGTLRGVRRSLRAARNHHLLKRAGKAHTSLRLVVGSGGKPVTGWIPSERENIDLLRSETWAKYFRPDTLDAILAEHVWEHLEPDDALTAAKNCFRFLRPGGYLRAAVPDGYHPDAAYIDSVRPGGNGPGSDDHRVLYNFASFRHVFAAVGFEVVLYEYFDKDGEFHFLDWNPVEGRISRSSRLDPRNRKIALSYTSVVLDAVKPGARKTDL